MNDYYHNAYYHHASYYHARHQYYYRSYYQYYLIVVIVSSIVEEKVIKTIAINSVRLLCGLQLFHSFFHSLAHSTNFCLLIITLAMRSDRAHDAESNQHFPQQHPYRSGHLDI